VGHKSLLLMAHNAKRHHTEGVGKALDKPLAGVSGS
jgi:hypothetical protein